MTTIATKEEIVRFWSHVDKSGKCWLWTAATDRDGYGWFWFHRKQVLAHRFALMLKLGRTLNAMALHKCDTPGCVRHLYEGTRKQNTEDAKQRGRYAKGERHPHAGGGDKKKLTEESVKKMRRLAHRGMTQNHLANMFGVCKRTVRHVVNHETWVHV